MLEQKFLDRFDMERRLVSRLYCFGSGSSDSDSGGSDVSDEDLDEDLQQDIAAAAVFQNQGSRPLGNYSYMLPDNDDTNALINATSDILTAAATAPPGQMQQAVDTGTAFAAQRPGVADALVNAAMTGLPPAPVGLTSTPVNMGNVSSVSAPSAITDLGGEVFDTTSGEQIAPDGSYFADLDAGLERIDGPAVPTPPPPRFQTNAQRDFFGNLAGQGDAAMNQFRAEVRNLDNRGFLGSQIAAGIGADGVPNFDTSFPAGSQIRGVTTTDFVDLPVIGTIPVSTYTGLDNPNASSDTSSDETVPPVTNPLTGRDQCPDGYVFDEDLQACRRKTKRELQADNGTGGGSSRPAGDMFFRRTSLDDAPANLPSGFDFDAANRAFTQSFAVRPSFFQRPPDLTGFTLL